MGQLDVEQNIDELKVQAFMTALLDDLRALDYMIDHDSIESGVIRRCFWSIAACDPRLWL